MATTHNAPRVRWQWRAVLAVGLLTFAAHLRGVTAGFLYWDDNTHITQNPYIRGLTWDHLGAMFAQPLAKLYVPVTWLSFTLDYECWGRDPVGYHLTNILLHVINTLLVMAVCFSWMTRVDGQDSVRARSVALIAAALFGVHPLHVESVAWATERKDVLFAFFFLLGLLAYNAWVQSAAGRGARYYALCFGLFVAACLSKATAVTFPVVLLLLDAYVHRRLAFTRQARWVWLEKVPFLVVSAIIGSITVWAQASGAGETVASLDAIPVLDRIGLVGFCSLFYLMKFVWPTRLSAIYPTFDEMGWGGGIGLAWLAALVAVIVLGVRLHRRAPVLLPALLFYLVLLSPTIGILPVGIHVVADRYAYLALLGPVLAVAVGLVHLAQRSRWFAGCAVVLLLVLTSLSVRRTGVWHDNTTLFSSVLRDHPHCLPALINLSKWYIDAGEPGPAIEYARQAVAVAPSSLPARQNLAVALWKAGRRDDAVAALQPVADRSEIVALLADLTSGD